MEQKGIKLNQSVEKVLQLVEVLSGAPGPMRLVDIAAAAGMPQSTALRMLQTLVACGYASQDPATCQYALSLKFMQIGNQVREQNELTRTLRPYLLRASERTRESVCLSVEEAGEVVYIDVLDGPDGMLQIRQRLGKRAPLYCTGSGKIFLTDRSKEAVFDYFKTTDYVHYTPKTVSSAEELWLAVQDAQARGFAMDNEECELGARCAAVGIRDYSGRRIAAISVSGPVSRMSDETVRIIVRELADIAREASARFGWREA